jgi:hypothetical protein
MAPATSSSARSTVVHEADLNLLPAGADSRRILHCNITEHPTAGRMSQQFHELLA